MLFDRIRNCGSWYYFSRNLSSNLLQELDSSTFSGLLQLDTLFEFRYLAWFHHILLNIRIRDLSYNMLTGISNSLFSNLSTLTFLFVIWMINFVFETGILSSIFIEIGHNFPSRYLNNNQLTSVGEYAFQDLFNLAALFDEEDKYF